MKHSSKVENIGGRDKWQTIVFGFINFVMQEIGMAFLPIILLEFLCGIFKKTYTPLTFYNNVFVGLVTLSVGNFVFLSRECKNINIEAKIVLKAITSISFSVSLIASSVTYLDTIGVMPIDINGFYSSIVLIVALFVCIVELIKMYKSIRRKLDAN